MAAEAALGDSDADSDAEIEGPVSMAWRKEGDQWDMDTEAAGADGGDLISASEIERMCEQAARWAG
jgi:hypothetical protein